MSGTKQHEEQILADIQYCRAQAEETEEKIKNLQRREEECLDSLIMHQRIKDVFDKNMNEKMTGAGILSASAPHQFTQGLAAHIEEICTGPQRRRAEEGFVRMERTMLETLHETEDRIHEEKKRLWEIDNKMDRLQKQLNSPSA